MPEWSADGMVISVRPYGENKAVVNVFTAEFGRHAGLVHGADSRSKKGVLELGNLVHLHWRARLSEQLGNYQIELIKSPTAQFLDNPIRLAALSSICAILEVGLPEREPFVPVWQTTKALIEIITLAENEQDWLHFYIRWEADFLAAIGFALGLERCAISARTDNLVYVSPKSGNAVHQDFAGEYADRMLALPAFLTHANSRFLAPLDNTDYVRGLALTGHFLARRLFALLERDLPSARLRLAHLVARRYNSA